MKGVRIKVLDWITNPRRVINWLFGSGGKETARHKPAPPPRARLSLEELAGRIVPASFSVINLNADGIGSLAEAIDGVNASTDPTNEVTFVGVTGTIQLGIDLRIEKNVNIIGPQPGLASITVRGNDTGAVPAALFRAFHIKPSATVTISNLTIERGKQPFIPGVEGANGFGGGIFNEGSLTLNLVTITNCTAAKDGGGIYNQGTLTTNEAYVYNSWAFWNGGGIYNNGQAQIGPYTTIVGNQCEKAGGGIYNASDKTLSLDGVSVLNNRAVDFGGGIANFGTLTAQGGLIEGNTKFGGIYQGNTLKGGGIYNGGGTATLTGTTISNNSATKGGGFYAAAGNLTLTNCVISNNTATGVGPAGAYVQLENYIENGCQFINNDVQHDANPSPE